jgi:periplasmic mercuric ion binding protein
MCRKTIEKAAKSAGVSNAFWDEDSRVLAVKFDKNKTSGDAILKSVAQSGYDNQAYKAPESAYNNLHSCCQYDRSGAPSTAKSCEERN